MWRRNYFFFAPPDDNGGAPPPPAPPPAPPAPPNAAPPAPPAAPAPPAPPKDADWRVIPDTVAAADRPDIEGVFKKYTSPFELAKAHVHATRRASAAITPLKANPTPEEVTAYRNSLKIPSDPDAYAKAIKVEPGQHFKMEGEAGEKVKSAFAKFALEKNMTPEHASAAMQFLTGYMDEYVGGENGKREEAMKTADQQLRRLWPGDNYDKNFASARAYIMGPEPDPKLVHILENTFVDGVPLNVHPVMVQWAAQRAAAIGEGNLVIAIDQTDRQQTETNMKDLTRQIWDATAAGDTNKVNELTKKRSELSARLHGNQPINRV